MNLKPFVPARYIAEIYQHMKPLPGTPAPKGLPGRSARPRLAESERFISKKDAEAYAASKTQEFDSVSYKGQVRPANGRDHAEQRLEEIAKAMSGELAEVIKAEENILAYDTFLYGTVNPVDILVPQIQEQAELLYEEDPDPVRDGWVGSDGLP